MQVFDCDSYLEALEKPSVKLNGKVYEGRILSINEYLAFTKRIGASTSGLSTESTLGFAKDYLYAVFPKRLKPWWRPDIQDDDPVPQLLNHPGLLALLTDFLVLQGKAVGMPTLNPTTNGTDLQEVQSVEQK